MIMAVDVYIIVEKNEKEKILHDPRGRTYVFTTLDEAYAFIHASTPEVAKTLTVVTKKLLW